MHLRKRQDEVSEHTIEAHQYRLQHFLRLCEQRDVDNLNDLSGRDIHNYKLWRRDDGDLSRVTVNTQMDTLRVFIRFCERIDAVENDLSEKVISPTLGKGEDERSVHIGADRAKQLLEYLSKLRYASFEHALILLLWRTGMLMGAARSIDVDDYYLEEARLRLEHRPTTGYPAKE